MIHLNQLQKVPLSVSLLSSNTTPAIGFCCDRYIPQWGQPGDAGENTENPECLIY